MWGLKNLFRNRSGRTARNRYLDVHGWYLSRDRNKAMTLDTHSAPLLPYSLADLLEERLRQTHQAFVRQDMHTYRWLLYRVSRVSSANVAMHRVGNSRKGRFERNEDFSPEALTEYMTAHMACFDLMLFDGPAKLPSAEVMLKGLAPGGVMVLINNDRDEYDFGKTRDFFAAKGFRAIMFRNPAPLYQELTAVLLYRPGNGFGI